MPFEQPPGGPPQSPEHQKLSPRGLIIALMGYLTLMREAHLHGDVLFRAPIKDVGQPRIENPRHRLYPAETKEAYDDLSLLLTTDLESENIDAFTERIQSRLAGQLNDPSSRRILLALTFLQAYMKKEETFKSAFKHCAFQIADHSFAKRFSYNAVIRGWNQEVLGLLDMSEKPLRSPLYIGMTLSYAKKLEPSGQTGPLTGKGKIVAFLFPSREGDIIPDQIIKLEIQTDDGPVETLLSLDEVA